MRAHTPTAAAGIGSDLSHAAGLLDAQDEREFPVTLPEVVEDKEQEDDPYPTWHALYGTEVPLKVRDLGLGFDSDEIVLFKFCVGSCQSSRTNYDLALNALLENGSLPRRTARKVSRNPCCRPDRYEPVSFMDTTTTWRTIQSLSAASCMCIG
ncbi:hypothetical protein XENOCAPTIV_009825 [Xenoophorus captivus]|uniref:TGF-beta family profile domain-containing protein n=1 Tax=Xenoophorus captivus TaxID=1517983 RepID=A0ABV0RIC8_9TELE